MGKWIWRRGWDSNPRYGFPHARFRGEYFKPLSHLSALVATSILAEASIFRQCTAGLCFSPALLAAFREERLDHRGTFGGENPGRNLDLMVETGVGKNLEAGTCGATFGIFGAKCSPSPGKKLPGKNPVRRAFKKIQIQMIADTLIHNTVR